MKTTTRKSTPPYHNSVFNLQRRKRFRGSHRRLRVRERIWWVFASHDVATSRIARVVVIFFGFFIQREGEGDGCFIPSQGDREKKRRENERVPWPISLAWSTRRLRNSIEQEWMLRTTSRGVRTTGYSDVFEAQIWPFFFRPASIDLIAGGGAPFFRFEKNVDFE